MQRGELAHRPAEFREPPLGLSRYRARTPIDVCEQPRVMAIEGNGNVPAVCRRRHGGVHLLETLNECPKRARIELRAIGADQDHGASCLDHALAGTSQALAEISAALPALNDSCGHADTIPGALIVRRSTQLDASDVRRQRLLDGIVEQAPSYPGRTVGAERRNQARLYLMTLTCFTDSASPGSRGLRRANKPGESPTSARSCARYRVTPSAARKS
jgi:hypothetical protein